MTQKSPIEKKQLKLMVRHPQLHYWTSNYTLHKH